MKLKLLKRAVLLVTISVIMILIPEACEPLATGFDDVEDAIMYSKTEKVTPPLPDSTLRVMTWNIRFGIGRQSWFGDACGDNTIFKKEEVIPGLEAIVNRIKEVKPDILFLQECDIKSTRTNYIDELQFILDNTYFNYAAYVSEWKADYIPSDGLGRMDMGLVILSPWPLTDAKRVNLATREDQAGIVNYFYLHSCMLTANVKIPGFKEIPLINIHASAFATDNTKKKHFEAFKAEMDKLHQAGKYFIAGGDLNELPPGSDSTDYCFEDICSGESFHQKGDDPQHKPGSNYTDEITWLQPIYDSYKCAVPLNDYQANQSAYFTHTTRPNQTWDRTLDYLFTNHRWRNGSTVTHQSFMQESDHAAVSSEFVLIKE